MHKVLILLADASDGALTDKGCELLREFSITYQMRVAAARLAPDYVSEMVSAFEKDGGQVILCLAPPADPLLAWVSAQTSRPVLPVTAWGLSAVGFAQAAQVCLQILALSDAELEKDVQRLRHRQAAQVIAVDQKYRVSFDG